MEAKAFLKQLKKLDKLIENKLIERVQWQSIATCTSAQIHGERVQTSENQHKMADAIDRYIDIEKEIDECIDQLIDTKKDVISVIEQLNASEYDLLHKVYVQFFTLQEVADLYEKSISWAKTIHKRGLKNVQRILDKQKETKATFLNLFCPKMDDMN